MDAFAALADPVRRELLRSLAAGPARVVDLAAAHPISRPAVSKHLRLLVEAGLVSAESRGRERHYRLESAGLQAVTAFVADVLRPPVPEHVLDALGLEVRRTVRDRRERGETATDTHPTRTHTEETA